MAPFLQMQNKISPKIATMNSGWGKPKGHTKSLVIFSSLLLLESRLEIEQSKIWSWDNN